MDFARSLRRISGIISWARPPGAGTGCRVHSARLAARWSASSAAHPTPLYLGSIACLSLGLIIIPLVFAAIIGAPAAVLLLVFILAMVPALTITVELVNWVVTQVVKPEALPHMDFSRGFQRSVQP